MYNKNTKWRAIYVLLIYITFEMMFKISNISINRAFYGIFLILILSYYIFGILTFINDYKYKDLIYSTILNGIIFYILLIFTKTNKLIIGFISFTLIQNILSYVFKKILKERNKIAIISSGEDEIKLKQLIIKNNAYYYVGFIDNNNINSIGNIENIKEIIKKFNISELVYIEKKENENLKQYMMDIKLSGVKIVESIYFIEQSEGKIDIDKINKDWVLKSSGFDILSNTFEKRIKRSFDIILALIFFLVGFPFMIFTYLLAKFDNPKNFLRNPAFFKQERIGFKGENFKIIKFRSMKLHDPKEHSKYAKKNDNRITWVGRFIRKTRLDELPQLINVLKGDMSFIGPRPEWDVLGRDYEKKINLYKLRYAVKPGLTGWAQVMYPYGENIDDAKRKLEYDIYYIKHQSFVLDIIILFKTIRVVIFGKGM